eukprot:1805220-Pyramimonas_sp.AAC.1
MTHQVVWGVERILAAIGTGGPVKQSNIIMTHQVGRPVHGGEAQLVERAGHERVLLDRQVGVVAR